MRKALSGLRAWIVQRFTAVYMLLFCIFVLFHFVFDAPRSFGEWHEWVSTPLVLIMMTLFFIALLMHTWVGLRDVVMDYVNPLSLRLTVLAVLFLILIGLALRIMQTLLLVSR